MIIDRTHIFDYITDEWIAKVPMDYAPTCGSVLGILGKRYRVLSTSTTGWIRYVFVETRTIGPLDEAEWELRKVD